MEEDVRNVLATVTYSHYVIFPTDAYSGGRSIDMSGNSPGAINQVGLLFLCIQLTAFIQATCPFQCGLRRKESWLPAF